MNILSLFDGISCGRVALERAGIKINRYYASEIDKYAIQVAQKNYPDTIQLGDINEWQYWNIDWDSIDLVIGGSPCQDLSIAKKDRKGLNGERSGLFWKYVEVLQRAKPKYFLLENVASMPKEAKQLITDILGVEPITINSALVSAQQRKRLYWTNIPNITQPEDKGILLKDILESGMPCDVINKGFEISKVNMDKSQCLCARDYKGFGNQPMSDVIEPICVNSQSGDRKGKRKQPSVADRIYSQDGKTTSLSGSYQPNIAQPLRIGQIGKGGQGDRIYSVKGKSVSLNANGGGRGAKTGLYKIDLPDGDYTIRKLTPIECERLQTLPDNYTEGISNTQRYKCLGNGWTVDVIAHIFGFINERTTMQALESVWDEIKDKPIEDTLKYIVDLKQRLAIARNALKFACEELRKPYQHLNSKVEIMQFLNCKGEMVDLENYFEARAKGEA